MTRRRFTLRSRLLGSHALVVLAGVVTVAVAVRLLDPYLLGQHVGEEAGHGPGLGAGGAGAGRGIPHAALLSALNWSLLIALGVSLVVAAVVATFAVRRILRPLDAVRAAARRFGAGHFEERVPTPSEPELAALAEDVNSLADALGATEKRRARLIGELAHELRTPLATLRGMLEGALDGVIAPDGPMLASALEEASRLERLSEDLAALSRAEEGALALKPESVDLGELAERASRRLRPQFEDKGVALTVQRTGASAALADPERVLQVVTNLLGNALRATPAGGTVALTTRPLGSRVELEVSDTGVGLAPHELARVFERFWRGSNPGGPGTGIGLTIARAIAEAHHGSLEAFSEGPGHGARFCLRLPAAPSTAPSTPARRRAGV